MILKKLKLCGFGPFKTEYEIDFSKLNESGIFLLTGQTGVGKTAIFDAISYALYGAISSGNQDIARVRSDYADYSIITYVELDFEINNILYHVRREPSQQVYGKNNKIINRTSQATLTYNDKIINKTSAVTQEITNILGLDVLQFRQIVMIPQGEFMKLLTSSSEEKVKIFRKIFKTAPLQKFEDEIFELSKKLFLEIKEVSDRIDFIFDSLIDNSKDEFIDLRIKKVNDLIDSKNEDINLLKKDILDNENTLNEFRSNYNKLNEENKRISEYRENKSKYNELLLDEENINNYNFLLEKSKNASIVVNKSNKIKEIEKEIDLLKEEKLNLNNNLSEVIENYNYYEALKEKLTKQTKEIDDLKFKLNDLIIKQSRLNRHNELKKLINEANDSLILLNKDLEENSLINENYVLGLDELDVLISDYNLKTKDYEQILEKNTDLKHRYNELKEYTKIELKKVDLKDDLQKFTEERNNALIREVELNALIEKQKILYSEDYAIILAKTLKDNEPCPVCGSRHHPKIALDNEILIDNEYLDNLNKELEECKTKALSANVAHEENYKKLIELEHEQELLNVLDINEEYQKTYDLLKETEKSLLDIKDIKNKLEEANNKRNKLNDLYKKSNESINKLNLEIQDLKFKIINYNNELNNLQISDINYSEEIEKLTKIIEDYETNLNNSINKTIEINRKRLSIENKIFENKTKTDNLIKELVELRKELNSYDTTLTEQDILDEFIYNDYENKISEFDKYLNYYKEYFNRHFIDESIEVTDLSKLELEISNLEGTKLTLNSNLKLLEDKVNNYKNSLKKIIELKNNNDLKIKHYEMVKKISKISTGDNRLKMSLEKYVLAIYFEEVINYANEVLKKLTDRYILIRKDELSKGNSQQGLDLDVYDYNTSIKRSVKTLSGGETFKASLALALGLSEMIKAKKSACEINTLFIDEGFGTLDQESLDSAINMLVEFKSQGLKIGIISHVSELKRRINDKILVERTESGSKIKVV